MNIAWVSAIAVLLFLLVAVLACLVRARWESSRPRYTGGRDSDAGFPYWRRALPPAAEMFDALRSQKLAPAKRGGRVLSRIYPGDYRRADAISNHYTEDARIDCRVASRPTPREGWELVREAVAGLDVEAQREAVYDASAECNIFNPSFARWIIEETAGRGARVLDPSAGWGDRLIGALAAGAVSYEGYDPNPRLQAGYRRIVDELGGGDHAAFRVAEAPFEDARVEPVHDIVFTSPPYFAYEVYVAPDDEGGDAQSVTRHPGYEGWVRHMYRPYLANAYAGARPGGWIILYVEDIRLKGRVYRLRKLTEDCMRELGARPAGRYGLSVTGPGKSSKKKRQARWALAWRKPL